MNNQNRRGTWLAYLVAHVTLDHMCHEFEPHTGHRVYLKNQGRLSAWLTLAYFSSIRADQLVMYETLGQVMEHPSSFPGGVESLVGHNAR